MGENYSPVVPCSVMGNEGNRAISKLMRAILNQRVAVKKMGEPDISLTMRTRLNLYHWYTELHIDEVFQSVPDIFKS